VHAPQPGLLTYWFLMFWAAHDWIHRLHARWFKLSREQFDAIHYGGMAFFKMVWFFFNLVPWVALCIVG
jgi:hypothetical protein